MKQLCYLISLSSILLACSVGPDYTPPEAPQVSRYMGESQRKFTTNIPAEWWTCFQSPKLNQMVNLSIKNNYSLQAMEETLKQAEENVVTVQSQRLPQINFGMGPGYEKYGVISSGDSSSNIPAFYYYTFGPNITWTLDIFGKNKRTIEQQQALVTYQKQERDGIYLTVIGNVVKTALMIAAINAKIADLETILEIDKNYIQQLTQGIVLGSTTKEMVIEAENQLHADEALLPPLKQQLIMAQSELNILVGQFPANWQPPTFTLKDFVLPEKLPLTIPSQLVHQRPDILAAEALLHASSATIGIATANLYPQLTLSASISRQALAPAQLFDGSSTAASVFAGLTAPLFSGDMLQSQKRAAEYAYKASYANYQDIVVRAFVQVSHTLYALNHDDDYLLAEEKALASAKQKLALVKKGLHIGNKNIIELLQAKRYCAIVKLNVTQAKMLRYQDTASFYLAVGITGEKPQPMTALFFDRA